MLLYKRKGKWRWSNFINCYSPKAAQTFGRWWKLGKYETVLTSWWVAEVRKVFCQTVLPLCTENTRSLMIQQLSLEQNSFEYAQIIMFFFAWYLNKQTTALDCPLQWDVKRLRYSSWQIYEVSTSCMDFYF